VYGQYHKMAAAVLHGLRRSAGKFSSAWRVALARRELASCPDGQETVRSSTADGICRITLTNAAKRCVQQQSLVILAYPLIPCISHPGTVSMSDQVR